MWSLRQIPCWLLKISHPVWPVHLKPLSNLIHADSRIVNQHTFGSYHYVCWLNTFRKTYESIIALFKILVLLDNKLPIARISRWNPEKNADFHWNHIEEHPYYSILFHTIPYYSILFHRSKNKFFHFLTGSSHISISIPSKIDLTGIPHLDYLTGSLGHPTPHSTSLPRSFHPTWRCESPWSSRLHVRLPLVWMVESL